VQERIDAARGDLAALAASTTIASLAPARKHAVAGREDARAIGAHRVVDDRDAVLVLTPNASSSARTSTGRSPTITVSIAHDLYSLPGMGRAVPAGSVATSSSPVTRPFSTRMRLGSVQVRNSTPSTLRERDLEIVGRHALFAAAVVHRDRRAQPARSGRRVDGGIAAADHRDGVAEPR
jgi:hypothetical protein